MVILILPTIQFRFTNFKIRIFQVLLIKKTFKQITLYVCVYLKSFEDKIEYLPQNYKQLKKLGDKYYNKQ